MIDKHEDFLCLKRVHLFIENKIFAHFTLTYFLSIEIPP